MDKEDGARAEVDDLLKHLLDELGDLENQLMANEIALQESCLSARRRCIARAGMCSAEVSKRPCPISRPKPWIL